MGRLVLALLALVGAGCGRAPRPSVAAVRRATETPQWNQRTVPHSPSPRFGASLVYEPVHSATLLFGGATQAGVTNEVWRWSGTDWSLLCSGTTCGTPPPARSAAAAAPIVNTPGGLIVYGGVGSASNELQDTYTLNWNALLPTWNQRCSPCSIPAARGAGLVVDGYIFRTLLFGGTVGGAYDNTTREWSGTTWMPACDPGAGCPSAPGRSSHALAYDPNYQGVLMFGGSNASGARGDTWLLAYASTSYEWTELSPAGSPDARFGAGMVYDPNDAATVLFGGADGTVTYGDTWLFRGSTWTKETTTPQPPPRYACGLTYATARTASVLYGGYDSAKSMIVGDTWERSDGAWRQRAVPQRTDHGMAYDSVRERVVAFGGGAAGVGADTVEWDGVAWVQLKPVASPPKRRAAAMAYHEAERVALVMGGTDGTTWFGDAWSYDGTTWTKVADSGGVFPAVAGLAAAYDSDRQRVVVFGGIAGAAVTNGTYELRREGGAWMWAAACTDTMTCSPPPARTRAAMTYDPVRKQVLLFGGFSDLAESAPLDDLWAWDGTAWTQLCTASPCNTTGQHPQARGAAGMTFDRHRGRALLFGGRAGTAYPPGIWEWDGSAWSGPGSGGPTGRALPGMVDDAARRVTLLFGGADADGSLGDTWEYFTVGSGCTGPEQCNTGFCSNDGVCCQTACSSPCQVCSYAAGAPADGTCTTAAAGYQGGCPSHVTCDGTDTCPAACTTSGTPGCETGFDCVDGACLGNVGIACTADAECASSVCAGRCCGGPCRHENATCGGTCDATGACSYPAGDCTCGAVSGTCAAGQCDCPGVGDGGVPEDGGAHGDGGAGGRKSVLSCAVDPGAAAGASLPLLALLLALGPRRRRRG